MNKAIAGAALGVMAMCLAACDGGKDEATATIGKAEGEILPRSVTDDMLPYDTLRSQPPLAEPEDGKAKDGAARKAAADGNASPGEAAGPQASEAPAAAGGQSQPRPGAE